MARKIAATAALKTSDGNFLSVHEFVGFVFNFHPFRAASVVQQQF